ncbi:cyclin-D5-3-like [Salvia miltiorrhiza]|uniref:cyclin-D5-3-like n=1 Tax=Salvia miltiorrhiza TaxID=226208 RepID=UPI0025AB9BB1|nr:cyclin-D5-3-like [Salvia miltiorrhiza]
MESTSQSMSSPSSLLLCQEDLGSLDCEDEEIAVHDNDDDDAYIQTLLDREITNGGPQIQHLLQNSWIERARLEGIDYILRKREVLGFGVQTAYASVTYLDRFLSRRSIEAEQSWAIKLLSMACLSLAAKMEEIRVPALSEFCVEDYNFESSVIQRMELLVLNSLGWKMGSPTPYNFTTFFANKFSANSFSTIMKLILSSVRDAKIMCHGPSVIAAAATLFVLDQGLTKDALQLKIDCLTTSHSFNIESIISCYNSFQEMDESLNLSKGIASPGLSPTQLQTYGSSSANSAKRRRLDFSQIDESSNVDDKKPKP